MEVNPGRTGVPLHKLASIARETEQFLRSLATDLGIETALGDWLATDFYNGSAGWNVEHARPVDPAVAARYAHVVDSIIAMRPGEDTPDRFVSGRTLRCYANIGRTLDNDEYVRIAPYNNGRPVDWRLLRKMHALEVERVLLTPVVYVGSLQGRLGTWYKESNYFDLRELAGGSLVKCYYDNEMYGEIHQLYKDRAAVVHVSGQITASRVERRAEEVRVSYLRTYEPLSAAEFEELYGSAPRLTGDLPLDEYYDAIRGNGGT
jgi:hypothetical protein